MKRAQVESWEIRKRKRAQKEKCLRRALDRIALKHLSNLDLTPRLVRSPHERLLPRDVRPSVR